VLRGVRNAGHHERVRHEVRVAPFREMLRFSSRLL
jgi:hypothetical protein